MRKKFSKKNAPDRRAGKAGKHPIKSADSFFHGPAGVFLICLLFFGLTAWAFAPAVKTNFQLFDENGELLLNAHMNSGLGWHNLRWALFSLEYANWYPLTWISHMIDFKLFGPNPWGHHLTNVLIHAANGVLLFLALKRMTGALWRSLIVAGLFALHPLRVESVAWISERKDVLSAFFGLLALWTYARFAEASKMPGSRPKLFYGLTLLFFAFGLMSKSMLVTFPFLLLLLDFWPLERWRQNGKWRLVMEKVPFFLLIVPVSIAVYFAQKEGGQFLLRLPLSFRLETALMGYARYLGKMFWPANFSVLYPYPDHWPVSQLLCAAALILGMSIVAFLLRRQRPYLLVGWLWYLGTLVPVIGLIPLGAQSMSNRYTYLPMIGIALLLVWAVDDLSKPWRRRTVLMAAVVALILGVCISRTRGEIGYWKNGSTLWSRAVAVTKNNFLAHYCLGLVLSHTYPDEALAEYQKSVDAYPDYADAQRELGLLLSNGSHFSNAIVHLERAIQLDPQNSWTYHGLGITLFEMGRAGDAVPPLLKAVEIDPQNTPYIDDLAQILFFSGHQTETVSSCLATARSDPAGFARLLDAVQFDTNHVDLINNLALCFATNPDPKLCNGKYAVRLATRACEMTGFRTNYFIATLAAAYAEDSRFDEAVSSAQLACSLASAAGQPELLKKYQAFVELFRSHQPYHVAIN
jgi:tetratricopeptide (TPR) repeat protein/cbb3-type cytochrome oxidase subunit 3